ncbi:hypothetical protein [Thalassoglobus polymorphus]|uniref:Uncharacterized protein n=1 Tax=Thalassoglobus polymorphus TaxID=2527994 RepID=A0A517QR08_9PLAN|nr:hypothetical protein [Thalassoglobus polymorphus]QDT34067.1 hypothetical protein Mal48_33260 [Thalassoglobus polymorphus]
MPIGNLQSGAGQLKDATQKLTLAWDAVSESWVDIKAKQFEEKTLVPVLEEVAAVMPAINQMSAMLMSAKRALDE